VLKRKEKDEEAKPIIHGIVYPGHKNRTISVPRFLFTFKPNMANNEIMIYQAQQAQNQHQQQQKDISQKLQKIHDRVVGRIKQLMSTARAEAPNTTQAAIIADIEAAFIKAARGILKARSLEKAYKIEGELFSNADKIVNWPTGIRSVWRHGGEMRRGSHPGYPWVSTGYGMYFDRNSRFNELITVISYDNGIPKLEWFKRVWFERKLEKIEHCGFTLGGAVACKQVPQHFFKRVTGYRADMPGPVASRASYPNAQTSAKPRPPRAY